MTSTIYGEYCITVGVMLMAIVLAQAPVPKTLRHESRRSRRSLKTKLHITLSVLDIYGKRTKQANVKKKMDFTSHFRFTIDPKLSIIEYQECRPRHVWPQLSRTNVKEFLILGAAGTAYQRLYHWHRDKVGD